LGKKKLPSGSRIKGKSRLSKRPEAVGEGEKGDGSITIVVLWGGCREQDKVFIMTSGWRKCPRGWVRK